MKKTIKCALAGTAMLALATSAQAATLLKMKDGSGQATDMWVTEEAARIEPPEPGVYMLMSLEDGSVRMVNDNQKQVLETDALMGDGAGEVPQIDLQFKRAGEGPEIAGYDTEHYVLTVGGQTCQNYYLSEDAVEDNKLQAFMEQMAALSKRDPGMQGMMDDCDVASRQVGAELVGLGLPLRVTDAQGAVESEVVEIQSDADAGDRRFSPPKDYEVISLANLMRQHMQQQ